MQTKVTTKPKGLMENDFFENLDSKESYFFFFFLAGALEGLEDFFTAFFAAFFASFFPELTISNE